MLRNLNRLIIIGLSIFVAGLIIPFIDIFIIKSFGKSAVNIGIALIALSLILFLLGVILTLIGFRKRINYYKNLQNKG
ncbi:MAG: hypothetical protein BJBARM5_0219 [Candidatus Parvarchaeum acidophilus ARMAN-5]|jgi:ABC-type multidrug transport system fused ATPase/permease subunit|uniref:Uncharacterized protein n=1 Tax=Candidatus Parvarchaeum acidophilus ARMAN-5 TaxID=662762 RepID=D6GUS3_PARA5|nr:MAG: hypothetical protein BJBARM5_0219 [Candidatus Parvarchaeum acidophilus ARMAN-5]